jgi:hypothetical protein
MKRLFILRESKGGKPIPNCEYDNKMEAKKARNVMNGYGGNVVVSIGPDHKLYEAK